jgi:antitoxin YobK
MSMRDLEEAFRLIDANPAIADFDGPKSEQLVARAEAVLELTFPPTYRRFLRHLGVGGVIGSDLYGVVDEDFEHSGIPDAVWLTLEYRRTSKILASFVIISDADDGNYFAIDVSKKDAVGESPIVEWCPGNNLFGFAGDDFGTFLLECVTLAVNCKDTIGE